MLGMKDQFLPILKQYEANAICPDFTQIMSVEELKEIVPTCDGWIIGDDPATSEVFEIGVKGNLKAVVKWGIGVDNIDLECVERLGIPFTNTPNMFGSEVADMAIGYLLALARETFAIDRGIRIGDWPKIQGMSLVGKNVGIVGYGDIGKETAKRLKSFGVNLLIFDPVLKTYENENGQVLEWPHGLDLCDFLIFTCSLNENNKYMLNHNTLSMCKNNLRIINVARGQLIDESALIDALKSNKVHSAALDVFEIEPLPKNSFLREHPLCILGSHNSSNTFEAVSRTNKIAIEKLMGFLSYDKK
jgi:D-3-phosphoglycerate dehydrogenase